MFLLLQTGAYIRHFIRNHKAQQSKQISLFLRNEVSLQNRRKKNCNEIHFWYFYQNFKAFDH